MEITLNGTQRDYAGPPTLTGLLADMGAVPDRVAVLLNGSVVRRDAFATCPLNDGDRLEVLTFAGGG